MTSRRPATARRTAGPAIAGVAAAALAVVGSPAGAMAVDDVNGNLIQFNVNGAWSWFEDERAVIDPAGGGKLLVSSIANASGIDGATRSANVDVAAFDLKTRRSAVFTLGTSDADDDHNTAALHVRPDGRYLAVWANHGSDDFSRYRVSTNAGDASAWQPARTHDHFPATAGTGPGATYSNVHHLTAGGGRTYNFTRTNGYDPNYIASADHGETWSYGGHIAKDPAEGNGGSDRPYVKYASNGTDRVYFITTDGHPRGYNNGVYGGYLQREVQGTAYVDRLYKMDGTPLGPPGDATNATAPFASAYTPILTPNETFNGTVRSRAWTTDLAVDACGRPYALFTSRTGANPGSTADHRLYYARWDGAAWQKHELARAGGFLYAAEDDYTGLGALDPNDPNTVYVSTKVDPRDATGATTFARYEIMKGVTATGGASWSWTPVTSGSTVDNLRPIVPKWDGTNKAVLWFRGTYTTYVDFDAAVVGLVETPASAAVGPARYVDASIANTFRADGGSAAYATGPAAGGGTDDDRWHRRTGFGNGGEVFAADDAGDAEDAPTLRTTAAGLPAGQFDVFAYFWSDDDEAWQFRGGLDASLMVTYEKQSSQHVTLADLAGATDVSANGGDLLLYRAYLGRATVGADGLLSVFVDDGPSSATNALFTRTWYDGIGYAAVPEPSAGAALLLAAAALGGRWHRLRTRPRPSDAAAPATSPHNRHQALDAPPSGPE